MRKHPNHRSLQRPGLIWLFLAATGLGCTGPSNLQAEREMDEVVEEQKAARETPPPAVGEALMPPSQPGDRPGREAHTERFDVSVRDLPARSFFLGLVEGTEQNIVVHPDVSGRLSLDLKGVTLEEVLDVARDIYGYEYQRSGNIYRIFPNQLRTQVFQVDYLDVQRVGISDTGVSTGTADSSDSDDRSGSSSGSGSEGGGSSANLLSMLGGEDNRSRSSSGLTPGSRVQTLNRTDFWGTLRETLSAIINVEEGGNRMVTVSPQSGMVVVKALPHELVSVRDFLERSELSITRQVILEAKILEVQLNEGFEAGINWGEISGSLQNNFVNIRTNSTDNSLNINRDVNNFVSATQTTADGTLRLRDNVFSSALRITDISELLSLLETQGNVQVLSSPRVSTVNNQKALIRVGVDEFFITDISNDTTSSITSVSSTPDVELSSLFSGIALDVTPQIAERGEVILHIHPIVSEVTDQLKNFIIGSENFSLPLARRTVRESDSIVRARSGQVIVLGGLMQETAREEDGKRPGLGDIPLVRNLFRTRNTSREKTELVILLKPVVVDDDTWDRELERTQDQMHGMGDRYRDIWDR